MPDLTKSTRGFTLSNAYRERYQFDSPEWRAVSGLIHLLIDELIFAEAEQVEDEERRKYGERLTKDRAREANQ